ncbi:Mob1/phocein [Gloeopeniophorella convolvens]|nr:Mob1/phocein [Gloeopeniophorella convolvens]KAI0264591.1 Mob1/phocein [Gloeopeniophorella convolvens]
MATAVQRPLKGSRISTFYPVKALPALSTLDSAFQLQEYISLTIRLDIHDVAAIISIPYSRAAIEGGLDESGATLAEDSDGDKDVKSEFAVDEACWIYEQLRRLAQDLSHPLITMLQQECTRATCPEMKAGEWMYLCVAHGNDGAMEQCCAIDYILHTVDSATALLNSPRAFPSRLNIPQPSHRHFSSLARRLGRIFAHAYFHHREIFEQAEVESSLYARFLALTSKFDLVPPEFLIIPTHSSAEDAEPPRLLAAAVDPQHLHGPEDDADERGRGEHRELGADILGGIDRNPSPRKGRTRTGTMVFSEALIMAEELSKGGSPSPEREPVEHAAPPPPETHDQEGDYVHIDAGDHAVEEEKKPPPAEEEEEEEEEDDGEQEDEQEELVELPTDEPEEPYHPEVAEEEVAPALPEIRTFAAEELSEEPHAPEQDVTEDADSADPEDAAEHAPSAAGEHDASASAPEAASTTIIELPPPEEAPRAHPEPEEDAQEEDVTEAVVEPQDEDDAADAREVAEQIAPDAAEPQENAAPAA